MEKHISLPNRQRLLSEGLVFDNVTLASGEESDVKFDFDRIQDESFDVAVRGLAVCIADNYEDEIDTLVTVASGANRLGKPIIEILDPEHNLGVRHVKTKKAGKGEFVISAGNRKLRGGVVLVDDVYTTGGSLEGVARAVEEASESRARIIGAAVLLNRSEMAEPMLSNGAPVRSVIHQILS